MNEWKSGKSHMKTNLDLVQWSNTTMQLISHQNCFTDITVCTRVLSWWKVRLFFLAMHRYHFCNDYGPQQSIISCVCVFSCIYFYIKVNPFVCNTKPSLTSLSFDTLLQVLLINHAIKLQCNFLAVVDVLLRYSLSYCWRY